MRKVWVGLLLLVSCITPRSLVLGQTAAPVGQGGGEVTISGGLGYSSEVAPPVLSTDVAGKPLSSQTASRGFALPGFEANAQVGLSRKVGLNVHASPAGIQPGIKWTLNDSHVAQVALLPEVAFGYGSYAASTFVAGDDGVQKETNPGARTMFTFMAGLKFIFSHQSGFYAGVGYDLIATRSAVTSTIGAGNTAQQVQSLSTSLQHSLTLNVGLSVNVGWLRIRPEIAFALIPAVSTGYWDSTTNNSSYGGYGWALLPCFSLTAATPPTTRDLGAEEDERNTRPDEDSRQVPEREESEKPRRDDPDESRDQ